MKSLKSVLAVLMAVCLMMCLAVPAFATEETTVATEVTEAATTATEAVEETTTAATEAVEETAAATTEAVEEVIDTVLVATNANEEEEHDHDHEETTTTGTTDEKSTGNGVIRTILIVLEVIASLALILIVLFQSGKEAGLSGALSGNNDSYMSKNGGSLDKKLAKATKWVALVWILITLALALI